MADVVYRGTLTKDKLKELAKEHLGAEQEVNEFNPHKNHDTISITRQPDGNWVGLGYFQSAVKKVRSWSPDAVLQGLITGAGEIV